MTDPFVPLAGKVSPDNSAEPFRVKVVASANVAAIPFQPLSSSLGASPAPAAPGEHAGPSQISLVRDGDRITSIRVHCACGEIIEMQCLY